MSLSTLRNRRVWSRRLTYLQNLVRQGLYYNYDYYKKLGTGAFVNEDMIVEKHICKFIVTESLLYVLIFCLSALSRYDPSDLDV